MSEKIWSQYQLAVFDNVANGTGNTVVKAVAGSGKTTTIVEALDHIPPGLKTLFVAFNKSIAEELKKRAPLHVEVSTLHSYGLRIITRSLGKLRIDVDRLMNLIRGSVAELETAKFLAELAAKDDEEKGFTWEIMRDLSKCVSLAKGALAGEEEQIDTIIEDFGIESPKQLMNFDISDQVQESFRKAFIRDVFTLLMRCSDVSDGCIDFDDMIWLPLILNLRQPQFDRVFIDETQDLNAAQIEMSLKAVKPSGRICAVGDPRQAIYSFRGADSAAVDNVVRRLNATVLPLSVCYRCCKAVIRQAQEVVPGIEWAPDAEEGSVSDATGADMKKKAKPGDFILSRTNAPLVGLAMWFLKNKKPATIQGRDIGASLAAFVKKSKAKSVEELRDYVEEWRTKECARLSAKRRDTQAVEDRAECILALSDGAVSVRVVVGSIESLFADKDDSNRIVLSSTHKAKGMERDRVWMLVDTYRKRPGDEEECLYYVAVTRARKELIFVRKAVQ